MHRLLWTGKVIEEYSLHLSRLPFTHDQLHSKGHLFIHPKVVHIQPFFWPGLSLYQSSVWRCFFERMQNLDAFVEITKFNRCAVEHLLVRNSMHVYIKSLRRAKRFYRYVGRSVIVFSRVFIVGCESARGGRGLFTVYWRFQSGVVEWTRRSINFTIP